MPESRSLATALRAEPFEAERVHKILEFHGFTVEVPKSGGMTRTEKLIDSLAPADERAELMVVLDAIIADLGASADPDRALVNFSRFCDVADRLHLFHELGTDPDLRARLCRMMGFSQALAETLVRQPELLDTLRKGPLCQTRPQLRHLARVTVAPFPTAAAKLEALRRFRRAQTLRIGLIDSESHTYRDPDAFHDVVRQISDLAQVCVQVALEIVTEEQNLETPPFAVFIMGKGGARELNYSSDIDLIFVHDGDSKALTTLGERLLKVLGDSTLEGNLFRVDMRLRPDGKSGSLVTPINYALSYYESFAGAWEWQAMIKCRAIAGDAHLARRFRRFTRGVSWARRADDAHLREMVEMKRRSETTKEGKDILNVKQGPGGIRDAEWVVQQLQMMVGPVHPRARVKDTLSALRVLRELDAITFDEALNLREGYLFLRVLEHRLQLLDERAVRVVPPSPVEQSALARRLGCTWRNGSASRWLMEELTRHQKDVRTLCEQMFYGWVDTTESGADDAVGNETTSGQAGMRERRELSVELSADSTTRLTRLTEGTVAQPLPAPLVRQIRAVLPGALAGLENSADPKRAVANLERLCDASGNRLSLLRAMDASERLGHAVLTILGGSQFLSDTLIQFPQLLDLAASRGALANPKSWEEARSDCRSYCLTFRDRKAALRRWKRREILRIGLRDLVMDTSPHEITREIAYLAQSCLHVAVEESGVALRPASMQIGFAVLGMGKLGGSELHYNSDCDVLFVHDAYSGDGAIATKWAESLMGWMGDRTEDGVCFSLDPRLRPNGRSGALCPSVEGFLNYFEDSIRGLAVWERQALTRARYAAGDAAVAARLGAAIEHVAHPEAWKAEWGDDLRHIKARVEKERGAKARPGSGIYDVKLGQGGLVDIEFTAQWLSLKHGAQHDDLCRTNTLGQIDGALEAGLLSPEEAGSLREAYTFLRRAELRLQITQEGGSSSPKKGTRAFEAWARSVCSEAAPSGAVERFTADWEQHTHAARLVEERVKADL